MKKNIKLSYDKKDRMEKEVLKVQLDLEEKPDADENLWYDGWLDFDIGSVDNNINFYSLKVSGPQNIISWALIKINEYIVGVRLTRRHVDIIKSMLNKWDIEVLAESKNRKTSIETETR